MKSLTFSALATVVVLAAGSVFAKGPHCGGGAGPGGGAMLDRIPNLTEQQKTPVAAIRGEERSQFRKLHPDMVKQKAELHEMVEKGAAKGKVDAKIDEIGKLHAQMMKTRIDALRKIAEVLDETQRQYLWEHGFAMGGGCGMCPGGMGGKGGMHGGCKGKGPGPQEQE